MRLTLRTLLAYLDDTLEPAQARLIGQKINESEQAQDLIKLIQQVTRRRRITTPPDGGPGGKLDPNTLGEYLDNVISAEQAAEVEEICLASDAHLAEIAACHQILSLILGEPALVPPSATQRMYGLVKGPEAIPFRKPPATALKNDHDVAEGRDVDDTLRLGIAPVTGKNKGSPWLLVLGGLGAACLLVVAVWQILKRQEVETKEPGPNHTIAKVEHKPPVVEEKKGSGEEKKTETKEPKIEEKKSEEVPLPEVKLPPVVSEAPFAAPSNVVKAAGKLMIDPKDPAILVQYVADKSEWQRITAKNPEVSTGRPLVSMPSSKSVIALANGVQLTLVGSVFPELFYPIPLYESAVELHASDHVDVDLTLRRGRIRVLGPEKQARVRVRFDNPTQPSQNEFFDLTLNTPGTEVLLDRWSFPPSEKYYRNPKDPNRVGPAASMACVVLTGAVTLKANDISLSLTAPPGTALIFWSSFKGLDRPVELKTLPEGMTSFSPGVDARVRTDVLRARDDLNQLMLTKAPDVALAEALKSPSPTLRRLAVHGLGAVDDVSGLLEQLEQEPAEDLRIRAIEVLRNWLASSRDNDYKLIDALKTKYRAIEAESIVTLLHGLNDKDLMNPDTYDLLINYLTHPQLPLRQLAHWHLFHQVKAGQKIPYNAAGDAAARQQAQTAWRALIPPNQLPPMPMKKQ